LRKMRWLRSPLVALVTLFFLLVSNIAAYAAIPVGTVIFSNGQALALGYANSIAHTAEVVQDVVSGGEIYVKMSTGLVINNSTGAPLTNLSILPAVTYKDANENVKYFATGDGPELEISSITTVSVNATVGTAPVLPATVTATMSDGTSRSVAVTWANVTATQYANTGTFTVNGTITNSSVMATANVTVSVFASRVFTTPSSVNSVLNGSQSVTLTAEDAYGNPIPNQTIYLGTGIMGLWITQVNGNTITGSVNMGTTSSPSIQTLNTPIPLFNLGTGASAPAYTSASVAGLTAYHLNDNTIPSVALTTGVDGTVAITLLDGDVTYVANTTSTTATNSYTVDPGTVISQQRLSFFSDLGQTQSLGATLVDWTNNSTAINAIQAIPPIVNSVIGSSHNITLIAQDVYGNPIPNQTIYLGTGISGLWITQVNGNIITSSVNMGTTTSPLMQAVITPVPLFNPGTGASAPAYQNASVTALTAYHLNDNTTPVVALTTGVDGTVCVTLADGNVTYVANTASTTVTNSYKVDPGTAISQQRLNFFSISAQTQKLGSALVNWTITDPSVTVISVAPINVTTVAGTAPILPTIVTATMSDGTTQRMAATWANIGASQYANVGMFTVSGTIANSTVPVTANVTVGATASHVKTMIASGSDSNTAYYLDSSGHVWAWGEGDHGELGNGTTVGSSTPVKVSNLSNIVAIAGEQSIGWALDNSGHVWAWGGGSSTPAQVPNLTNIVAIAAGYGLDSSGHVWAWGENAPEENLKNIVAIAAGNGIACALDSSGYVWTWGVAVAPYLDSLTPAQIPNISNIVAIAAGASTDYALDNSGHVWVARYGSFNPPVNATPPVISSTPIQVANLSNIVAISAGLFDGFALEKSGHVWTWSVNAETTPVQVPDLTNIVEIAGGGFNAYALDGSGNVWAWGWGYYGSLGNGKTSDSNVPVQVFGLPK